MSTLKAGKLVDTKVTQKIFTGLHKGNISPIWAIVVHQTGAPTAKHTFNSYKSSSHGAHFLIDKKGKIYQTALLTKLTHHVGKIKSRCIQTKVCTAGELATANSIYFKKGKSYSVRLTNLYKHEKKKAYPARYPLNKDSIGIEIVGDYDKAKKVYERVNNAQNKALKWLVGELGFHFVMDKHDVYRHPEVSYKKPSEARTAAW